MMRNCILATALTLCMLIQAPSQEAETTSVVHIKLLHSPNADDLGIGEVEFFRSQDTGLDYASRFRNNTASNIPHGTYYLRARVMGFQSAERQVIISKAEVWIVLGLEIGRIDTRIEHELKGTVIPQPSVNEPVWVRLTSLRSATISDAKLDESGRFLFAGLPTDSYVLAFWSGTRVLYIRPVKVPTQAEIVVDLSRPVSNF